MTESKMSEAQKKASKAYYEKNKERALMNNRRTAARTFVRHYATKEDMENLIRVIYLNILTVNLILIKINYIMFDLF